MSPTACAQGFDPAPEQRRKLVAAVLPAASIALERNAPSPHLLQLCTLLKLLGRSPAGTEELTRPDGLGALLRLGGLARAAELATPTEGPAAAAAAEDAADAEDDDEGDAAQAAEQALASLEADPLSPAEQESLRCLANTLTLHPSAREHFPGVLLADERRRSLRGLVRLVGCSGAGFLAGRLLFLLTSRPSELVGELALEGECVVALQQVRSLRLSRTVRTPADRATLQFADRYLAIYRSEAHRSLLTTPSAPGTPSLDDILREHLKLAYNLMLQYSRAPPVLPEGFGKPHDAEASPAVAAAVGSSGKKRFWRSREKSGASSTGSSPELGAAEGAAEEGTGSAAAATPRGKSPLAFARKVVGAVKGSPSSSPAGSPSLPASKELGPAPASTATGAPPAAPAEASEGSSPDSLSLTAAQLFLPLFHPYLTLAVTLPLLSPAAASPLGSAPAAAPSFEDPSPVVRAALNTLLNFPVELEELSGWSTSWLQYVPPRLSPEDGTVLRGGGIGSLGERLLDLLRGVCDAYFPPDRAPLKPKTYTQRDRERGRSGLEPPCAPDEWIPTGEGKAGKVEEILGPVMLLLRKLSMLGEAQFVFRNVLYPPGLCVALLISLSL